MEILKHKRPDDDYNMAVKEIGVKIDGREMKLAKEFPAKEFDTSAESLGFLTTVFFDR